MIFDFRFWIFDWTRGERDAHAPSEPRGLPPRHSASRRAAHSLSLIVAVGLLLPETILAANTGEITGQAPGAYVKAATAIRRDTRKKYSGTVDRQSSTFTIEGLPLDAAYDVILDFDGGPRLEGIDLAVPPSDYEEEQPLIDEDIETITKKVRGLNKFEDVVDVLAIQGNIQHAVVLLNKLRTRPFFNSQPGEVVWRAELWHFERPDETWVKVQDELFVVLHRERLQAYRAKSVTFDGRLGGLRPTADSTRIDLGAIDPPDTEPGIRLRPVTTAAEDDTSVGN
jgi:hypothetical protein